MYQDPNLHCMQIGVPHSVYGECTYFIPNAIRDWFAEHDISNWAYVGGDTWGNGYTDGVSNAKSSYMVYNIQPEDATAFGINFPNIKIFLSKQYDYSKTEENTRRKSTSKGSKNSSRNRCKDQTRV